MDSARQLKEHNSPLSQEQAERFNRLVQDLSADQMNWLSGYLAGLSAAGLAPANQAPPAGGRAALPELTVVYGSQTGNSEKLAGLARQRAADKGFRADVYSMADVSKGRLKKAANLLVIVSTHGEGDPPDSAAELHELVHSSKAPPLQGTRFAVLALGDSSYEHFCQTGKDMDERLAALGAERLHPRVDCDVDYEEPAEQWMEAVLDKLAQGMVPLHDDNVTVMPVGSRQPPASEYSKRHPFDATVLENICLNGRGSNKEVRHVELSLEGSGLTYAPGDSLGIAPKNNDGYVAELIDTLGLDSDAVVAAHQGDMPLHQALSRAYEITTVTRPFIEGYARLAGAGELESLLDEDNRQALRQYVEGRQIIDVVKDYPASGLRAEDFIALLRKLPPRLYSIASSYQANPDEVHITVAAVRYHSLGRDREGVASTFLADRVAEGDTVPVYVEHNSNFKLPEDPEAPLIMVGPGTGVAPFRAFMAEREEFGSNARHWLFFGDQHLRSDFLYQREWLRYRKEGLLTHIDAAWSRDTAQKEYVQHRMRARGRDLYAWLQEGAYFYVCGDARRMAPDVHNALVEIVAEHGGASPEDAAAYVKQLQKERRYQRDVY